MNGARLPCSERFRRIESIFRALPGEWKIDTISDCRARARRADGFTLALVHCDGSSEFRVYPVACLPSGQMFTLADWGVLPPGSSTPMLYLPFAKPNALIAAAIYSRLVHPFERLLPELSVRTARSAEHSSHGPLPDDDLHPGKSAPL